MQCSLHGGAYGPGIKRVFGSVVAAIDTGKDQVRVDIHHRAKGGKAGVGGQKVCRGQATETKTRLPKHGPP